MTKLLVCTLMFKESSVHSYSVTSPLLDESILTAIKSASLKNDSVKMINSSYLKTIQCNLPSLNF